MDIWTSRALAPGINIDVHKCCPRRCRSTFTGDSFKTDTFWETRKLFKRWTIRWRYASFPCGEQCCSSWAKRTLFAASAHLLICCVCVSKFLFHHLHICIQRSVRTCTLLCSWTGVWNILFKSEFWSSDLLCRLEKTFRTEGGTWRSGQHFQPNAVSSEVRQNVSEPDAMSNFSEVVLKWRVDIYPVLPGAHDVVLGLR